MKCQHSVQTMAADLSGRYHCHQCHATVSLSGMIQTLIREVRCLQSEVAEQGGVLNKMGWHQCRYCETWVDFKTAWGGWHTKRQDIGFVCAHCILTLFNDESLDLGKEYFSESDQKQSLGNMYYWIAAWVSRTGLDYCQDKEYKGLNQEWLKADPQYRVAFQEYRKMASR